MPASRQKWQHVEKVLDGVPWHTLEFLDGKGKLVGQPWRNDAAPTEVEELGEGGPTSKRIGELAQLANIFLRAQDLALQRHNEALRPMLDANRTMLTDLTQQLVELRRETSRSIERERELMLALADAARGEDGETDLPKLATLLPLLLGAGMPQVQRPPQRPPTATPPKAATPPNGTRPPVASKPDVKPAS